MSARNPCDLRILGPVPLFAEYGKSISLNCTMRCPNSAKGWETSLKKTELSEGSYWTWTTVAIGEWVSYPQCYVIDVEGDVSVTNTTIKAYQPPENVSISLPPLMQVGHPYFFTCSVQAVAPMEYFTMFLRKGNTTLHATSYHNVFGNSNFTHSQIIIAQRADHGVEYTCLARLYLTPSGELFEKSASVLVHTFGLPKEPTIDVLDYMELGSVVMATCKVAEAFPLEDVEVALQFDGRDLNVSVTRDNDMLTLEGAVPSDWPGKHMLACQATVSPKGEAKTVERFVYIYSFPEPYLNIQDVNTLAGQDVNITCVLQKSDPREALVVIKGNATLKTCKGRTEISCSHILRIEKEDHNRKITCEATLGFLNIFKTASFVLNVSYAPDFSPSLCQDTVTWMEGAQATFFCEADGNPLSHVECTKDGRDNLITGWSEVTRNQSGVYQCLATNIHGHRVKNVTVRVEYGPEFSDSLCPSSLTWVEGTPYMFSCEADGSPEPHINCSKDDEINAIGHRLEVSRHDSGTYRCKASNRHGVAVKNVTVIVEYAPKFNSSLCSKTHTWVEGAQAIIPSCEAVGNPPPHVQCTNNAGVNVRWNGSEITRNQSGIYQCLATNKHGHDAINIAVTVEYGPAFSEFTCPSTLMWVEGTAATFSCEADGRPTPRVECTKDGGPNAIRHWPTVTRHDAGTYRCNTSNRHGVALKNVAVRVEYKPGFSDTLCPSSVTWVEGTDVTSACQASGNPTPYIECIQEGGTKTLTNWSHITRYDYGTYQCHASNIHGFDVKNVTVTVEYGPEFTDVLCPSSQMWVEGDQDIFTCNADGNPAPVVKCFVDDRPDVQGHGPGITRPHSGLYQCKASNLHGIALKNVTVVTQYPPKFNDALCLSLLTWTEGSLTTFSCEADGNPTPSVKCTKDGIDKPVNQWLKISRNDSGFYQCIARNSHGSDVWNVEVIVEYKPDITCIEIIPSESIYRGQKVTLKCQANGFPGPTYHWRTPYNSSLTYSPDNSTVTIMAAEFQHGGVYECEVRNKHGSNRQQKEIHVKDILPIILGVVIGALALVGMAGISLKIYLLHRAEISQEYQVSRAQGVAKEENSTNTYTKMAQFQICDT
ncbi:intercellular adhesion molecule 5 isoform X2 [Pleurodeles waltl]|uniref:intercellular adhesion molecule 5 isoform X2 n=1 Tax=Pleurodeles waltl TaxID=8319 RepID=UPI0037097C8C